MFLSIFLSRKVKEIQTGIETHTNPQLQSSQLFGEMRQRKAISSVRNNKASMQKKLSLKEKNIPKLRLKSHFQQHNETDN